mmetsp:Transcript_26941/g.75752  ORF Transcript_26941/g.75752 Transcript_26941/m.75752 type:complete len:680 (+) Transcript_26941:99-2138(+)
MKVALAPLWLALSSVIMGVEPCGAEKTVMVTSVLALALTSRSAVLVAAAAGVEAEAEAEAVQPTALSDASDDQSADAEAARKPAAAQSGMDDSADVGEAECPADVKQQQQQQRHNGTDPSPSTAEEGSGSIDFDSDGDDVIDSYREELPDSEFGRIYYQKIPNGGSIQWAQGPFRDAILNNIRESVQYLEDRAAAAAAAGASSDASNEAEPCINDSMLCTYYAVKADDCPVIDNGKYVVDEEDPFLASSCQLACKLCDAQAEYLEDEEDYDDGEAEEDEDDIEADEGQNEQLDESNHFEGTAGTEDDIERSLGDLEGISMNDDTGYFVKSNWGVDQFVLHGWEDEFNEIMEETDEYMTSLLDANNYEQYNEYYDRLQQEICRNTDPMCSLWAADGACEEFDDDDDGDEEEDEDKQEMAGKCGPACGFCEDIDYKRRCPPFEVNDGAWSKPGDVDSFFKRITTDPYYQEQYGPMEIIGNPEKDYNMPWIVTFDNFLTDEECARLSVLGEIEGYERSMETGDDPEDAHRRTSTNSWCKSTCYEDAVTQRVHRKLDNFTLIPHQNSEYLQLLRYKPGQQYKEHHDYIVGEEEYPQGPRILTVFMYMNDVEKGGGTHFSDLNITVQPKKGRVLLWPSVLNDYPFLLDLRTTHEALPVEAGTKKASNAWFHQREHKTNSDLHCT